MRPEACPYCGHDLGFEEPHLEFLRHVDERPRCKAEWDEWREAMMEAEIRTE